MSLRLFTSSVLRALYVVSLLASTAACRTGPYVWVQNLPREASNSAGTIAAGDLVEIRVFGEEALTTRARVRQEGVITVPLLGQVTVVGEKPAQLAMALSARLKPFVNDPHVTVVVLDSEVAVTVVGEVKQVGVLTLPASSTVLQALAKSGGPTEFANRAKIFVLRETGGRSQRVRFTYDALLAGEPAATGFRLQAGDVLVVE